MWTFRPALADDAAEACLVVRRSIEDLCGADHGGDPAILQGWLANKEPERFAAWIGASPSRVIVGTGPGGVAGVGMVSQTGRIELNYVAPWARFRGVSRGVLRALEEQAASLGNACCTLTSTATAHRFYASCGYEDAGPAIMSFGGKPAFPMWRAIAGGRPG